MHPNAYAGRSRPPAAHPNAIDRPPGMGRRVEWWEARAWRRDKRRFTAGCLSGHVFPDFTCPGGIVVSILRSVWSELFSWATRECSSCGSPKLCSSCGSPKLLVLQCKCKAGPYVTPPPPPPTVPVGTLRAPAKPCRAALSSARIRARLDPQLRARDAESRAWRLA